MSKLKSAGSALNIAENAKISESALTENDWISMRAQPGYLGKRTCLNLFVGVHNAGFFLFCRITQIKNYSWDNAQIILVGNKCDMEDERAVVPERGRQLAEHLNVEFFETSAKVSNHETIDSHRHLSLYHFTIFACALTFSGEARNLISLIDSYLFILKSHYFSLLNFLNFVWKSKINWLSLLHKICEPIELNNGLKCWSVAILVILFCLII